MMKTDNKLKINKQNRKSILENRKQIHYLKR